MLLKNLKAVFEAAEPPAPEAPATDGTTVPVEKPEPPKAPSKFKKQSTDASNGVGEEAYKISTEIAQKLSTDLVKYYKIRSVTSSNNTVSIVPATKNSDGALVFTSNTENPIEVPIEKIVEVVKQMVVAILSTDINKFQLSEPLDTGTGILMFNVVPIAEGI